jgi:hypothetical protein
MEPGARKRDMKLHMKLHVVHRKIKSGKDRREKTKKTQTNRR